MHIHWLQHVPFEGLGMISRWAAQRGYTLSSTRFWAADELPEPDSMDLLVIMGGPMAVHDEHLYPWLMEEKRFIRRAVNEKRVVLGICLGAQLLASVCGASVYQHSEKEIGWFPVTRANEIPTWAKEILPAQITMFHWHGDTFDIPDAAILLCSSSACRNQGFVMDDRIIALQFHFEMTSEGVTALVDNCRSQLDTSLWVQNEQQILNGHNYMAATTKVMEKLLDHCVRRAVEN